jgi:hypothetical protein
LFNDKFTERRGVAVDTVDGVLVSTVFLGVDHTWSVSIGPLLFETMLFDHNEDGKHEDLDGCCARYSTWQQAKAGHEAIEAAMRSGVFTGVLRKAVS